MRIAVIGSGISGLSAAYILAPHASVTLYEKEDRLGGHTHTINVPVTEDITIPVDTGFMVFNPPQYPELSALFGHLGIETVPTDMSFSMTVPGEVEWASTFPRGFFANWRTWTQPRFWLFAFELFRFFRVARHYLTTASNTDTIRDFLRTYQFSDTLAQWYLTPMVGAIWSSNAESVYDFPARELLQFLDNHQLLQGFNGPLWRTVVGGSNTYIDAMRNTFMAHNVDIRLNQSITHITRTDTSATVHTTESADTYDWVICATHADTALALLEKPSDAERDILGAFTYSKNTVVVHRDPQFMPPHARAWSSWNYYAHTSDTQAVPALSLTYNMNMLQHIDTQHPVFITLNPHTEPDPSLVYTRLAYTHPQFPIEAQRARERLGEIQGIQRTLYTGAHWGYGFHEDGLNATINALTHLNITPSWKQ